MKEEGIGEELFSLLVEYDVKIQSGENPIECMVYWK